MNYFSNSNQTAYTILNIVKHRSHVCSHFGGQHQTTARARVWCDAECGGNLGNLNSKGPAPQISVPGLLMDWDVVTAPVMVDTKHAPCVLAWSQLWLLILFSQIVGFNGFNLTTCVLVFFSINIIDLVRSLTGFWTVRVLIYKIDQLCETIIP